MVIALRTEYNTYGEYMSTGKVRAGNTAKLVSFNEEAYNKIKNKAIEEGRTISWIINDMIKKQQKLDEKTKKEAEKELEKEEVE